MKRQPERKIMIKYLAGLMLAWCVSVQLAVGTEINVFAAASLTDAMKELGGTYEAQSGDKLVFNFAGSNALARQIKEGAPADVFFSADEAQMSGLEKAGLIADGSRESVLSNTLVVVAPKESAITSLTPEDLARPQIKRLALADTKTVPAGVYSKEYLEKLGLWKEVEPKVLPTENVRAALAAVESGNVDAGIVYKTDASISKNVKVVFEVPASEGPKISYPVGVVRESKNPEAARKFLDYLKSERALTVFGKYGFIIQK
ncbi:MAG: molybdate ABC transporter substrate-binding protein [Terrimicrobiaceae bacterium]